MSIELYNDDCFNLLSQFKNVDLIVTDPPYLYDVDSFKEGNGGTVNNLLKLDVTLKSLNDKNLIKSYDIERFGSFIFQIQEDVNVYFWCNKAQIPSYLDYYVIKNKCKFDILCWHKTNALPTYSNKYLTDTEYLLYFHRGKGRCFPQNYQDATTYYMAPINHSDKKKFYHPTIKPIDITMKIIRNSSKEGQLILDPFMGSGTTGVACNRLKRDFIGIEINKKYFDIAKERINQSKGLF